MRGRQRGAAALLVLAVVCSASALAGCGVPNSTVERVPSAQVPSGLVDPAPAGGPPGSGGGGQTAGGGSGATAALLDARVPSTYLLDGRTLVAAPLPRRQTATGPARPSSGVAADEEAAVLVTVLLRGLNGGPTPAQRDQGLSTALGFGVPVTLVEVVGGTAHLALRQPDRDPSADRLPLAIGQVVLTVTSAPGVERVQLLREGAPTAVPLPNGVRTDAPVDALDYAVLLDARRAG